ncbi:MAG: 5'/3'-nucleotidase SurE [Caldilinea sp.]|nr:5'/3'-nucleotidase SurE [Caldilineaceae bacterium]MCB9126224.1 5'/3'-nucleotidase SurE [Caldilineaceae bacterium]MCO5212385.1 5'/3'-nucleotidase SurE [Caldilinea sp.]
MSDRPLILLTNDDGVHSFGLHAAVAACEPLGDLLVAAPIAQQTAAGRSKPVSSTGRLTRVEIHVHDRIIPAYGVDASPAQAVEHALFELAPRPVDLVVSGINYGENVGEGLAVSGTLGAALEGASFGIPAIAISRQTAPEHFLNHRAELDFGVAAHFLRKLAAQVLAHGLPAGADLLKIDVPERATPETACRWTRQSRRRYFIPIPPQRTDDNDARPMGFELRADPDELEADSDVRAVILDGVVSITPISGDMTAAVPAALLAGWESGC